MDFPELNIRSLFRDLKNYVPIFVVNFIIGIFVTPYLTRLFVPKNYGELNIVIITSNIFSILVGWVSMAVIRFYPEYDKAGKLHTFYAIIKKAIILSFCIILPFYIIYSIYADLVLGIDYAYLYYIGILQVISYGLFQIVISLYQIRRLSRLYAAVNIFAALFSTVLTFILAIYFKIDVSSVLWGQIIAYSSVIIYFVLNIHNPSYGGITKSPIPEGNRTVSNLTPNLKKSGDSISGSVEEKKLLKVENPKRKTSLLWSMFLYSLPLVIGNVGTWFLKQSNRYIMERMLGAAAVGIYSPSFTLADITYTVTILIQTAAAPMIINTWEHKGKEATIALNEYLAKIHLMLSLPVVALLTTYAHQIISILTAPAYHAGYIIVPFIALGSMLVGFAQRYQVGLIVYKKTFYIGLALLVAGVLNPIFTFILIPFMGLIGPALATLMCSAIYFFIIFFSSKKYLTWKFPLGDLLKILGGCVLIFVVGSFLNSLFGNYTLFLLLVSMLISGTCFAFVILITKVFTLDELESFLGFRIRIPFKSKK